MQMGKEVMLIGDSVMATFVNFGWLFFFSKLDLKLLKIKVASKRELASKQASKQAGQQASGLSSLNHLEKAITVNRLIKTMS